MGMNGDLEVRHCHLCNTPYVPKRRNQRWCSARCRIRAYHYWEHRRDQREAIHRLYRRAVGDYLLAIAREEIVKLRQQRQQQQP